ncbi:iron chelate uptake ABC transporter family permease subunit [Microbacterium sp.]|uniref:iron chelate uptake ABC transporter family permease subunit n=1 Tax=Microbacterium sp. TaxID=51671 RepID=UPI0039E706D4
MTAPTLDRALPTASSRGRRRLVGFVVCLVVLVVGIVLSVLVGARPIGVPDAIDGILTRQDTETSLIMWELRIPRTLLGVLAGIAYGLAGALIQAVTRNPLADPGLLGVNAGAGFAIVIGVTVFGVSSAGGYVWFGLIGALAAAIAVYLIGAAGGVTAGPVQLVLAGVSLSAVLVGISTTVTLWDPLRFQQIRSWGIGSLTNVGLPEILACLPLFLVAFVLALALGPALNALALGEDLAVSLGARTALTRVIAVVAVTLLAGAATALTGGISFVGLMVPHIVRWFTGPDQRWILAYTAIAAPALVLAADIVGRVVVRPSELEVGVVIAAIGAPVLIALVRRRRMSAL